MVRDMVVKVAVVSTAVINVPWHEPTTALLSVTVVLLAIE